MTKKSGLPIYIQNAVVLGVPHQFHNPQRFPLSASTADFRDFGDRVALGQLGVYSVDRPR